jgi:putative membrane protein
LKTAIYIGGLVGLAVLIWLVMRADLAGMLHAIALAGWSVFWLVPYRLLFFLLYAVAWDLLLRPYDPQRRLTLSYLLWVAAVREAIDRLLPVASVGGGVVGVRLLGWRGIGISAAAATVIVEVLLTLIAVWAFAVISLLLLASIKRTTHIPGLILTAIVGLALPVLLTLTLRYGSLLKRAGSVLRRWVGLRSLAEGAASLNTEVRSSLRRVPRVILSGALQLAALLSGAFEVWFALRLFGHPVGFRTATVMEGLTQAARHIAFVIPGGLGVQEFTLIALGNALGIGAELALGVSLVKRLREIICGVPALLSWQWSEGLRLRRSAAS